MEVSPAPVQFLNQWSFAQSVMSVASVRQKESDTWLMSVDVLVASIDQDENIKTRSFQPTLWLSSALEIDWP